MTGKFATRQKKKAIWNLAGAFALGIILVLIISAYVGLTLLNPES